ncbi:hypothetical protein F2Q70_00042724 [Brassica cretica]|uniref:PI3K/PI4K catalytic domain-containing protein n=1 Tax=Brassica cretica TaxID=69181 RepID=A0A8S9KGX8_BRACR|nr:hypothetical protein F2Q70_00042724 [Brassica cretica]
MEALTELCDIIEENPIKFSENLIWICRKCPQPESSRVSRDHLNAVLAVARIISRNVDTAENHGRFVVLGFLQSVPKSFHRSFWPDSFTLESISAFYCSFLGYVSCASDWSPELGTRVVEITMICDRDAEISRAFLVALSQNFPPIQQSDGSKLITMLLHASPPSPISTNCYSSSMSVVVNGESDVGQLSFGFSQGSGGSETSFYIESIESLEKQEVNFKLITHVLDNLKVDSKLHDQVSSIAKRQLQSMSAFLKSKRPDDQDPVLKTRVKAKLFVYQAAAKLKIKSLMSLKTDGKTSKMLVLETLTLLLDAEEACLTSTWREMKACKDLFISLLSGIAEVAVAKGGYPLRVFFIRLKPLVLAVCAQPDTCVRNHGNIFGSVIKICCKMIESCWTNRRALVDSFIVGLASRIRVKNDYEEQVDREKEVPALQLNVIQLLSDISVVVKKPEVADMVFPFFIESLEENDTSTPYSLQLQLLDAVSRIATLGFEKSYHETVVLMTRGYLSKISTVGSEESKASALISRTEHLETLAAGFLTISGGLMNTKLRADYRHHLLSLCSDVGMASESKSGGSGAGLLGPLLPAVAEICSDFNPTSNVEPSVLKLFRNLWFYIALFGLAPPILKLQLPEMKTISNSVKNAGKISTIALQSVGGPYKWNALWALSVQKISHGTPSLAVSTAKWLEDELELTALYSCDSSLGIGNKKVASTQRTALSIALGGRVGVAAINTISGVKATCLLAIAFLEIIRFTSNGGILNGGSSVSPSRSAFSCVFEYLKSPDLTPTVSQCLTTIVHRAFEAALSWLEEPVSLTGKDSSIRESTMYAHACFLINNMSQRDERIRYISVNLLIQIRDKFPQVLWSSSCLDSLLFSVHHTTPSTVVNDLAWSAAVRYLYHKVVREWIIISLSYAPCTSQGLLQDKLCKANTLQRTQTITDVVSILTGIKIGTGKNEIWSEVKTANIPAVIAAAVAASGENLKASEAFNLEIIGTGVVNAILKCNYTGKIGGVLRLKKSSDNDKLINSSVRGLQQFVNTTGKVGVNDKSQFRETCSHATSVLLSYLQAGEPKTAIKGFSRLLRLLCWCPVYILTPDAMETGIFIWTWLLSAAPQLGSLVLAELVDAWIWTIDSKRGLFASDVRNCGPAAKLRPKFSPGEPEGLPESDPVDQIVAHRQWLGFLIDRFEVVRHNSMEQFLLFGRLLQRSTNLDWCFTHHPAAAGTFFSLMLLGLRFCSYQRQGNLHKHTLGLELLEDRIYRLVEGYLLRAAQRSDIFAHILTWHLQGESFQETVKDGAFDKNASFQASLAEVRQHIIDGFTLKALDLFNREFDFFEKVTSISGALFPLPKEERRAGIRRELEKIKIQGEDLYLPTAPNKLVKGIQIDSGIPLQSAAKVPIMITFNVVDRDGNHNDVKPQACIFKVGDDCRQDVLALQVISLLRDIFEAVGLNLYLFPYGVLPTGAGRGIIEVVPYTRSRSQMGESTDGGLYEIFQQEFGPVGSPSFETARGNFLTSSAGYAVASLLLQPKDRHNGNLLFDKYDKPLF